MKRSLILIFSISTATLLTACASGIKVNWQDKSPEDYFKTKDNTVNMSEYDKQHYYIDNNLGVYPQEQNISKRRK